MNIVFNVGTLRTWGGPNHVKPLSYRSQDTIHPRWHPSLTLHYSLLAQQPDDVDGIMATMTHIRDVRKKAPMVTGLFGPLKDTVMLLKSRGIAMDLPPVNKQVLQKAHTVETS